MFKFPSHAIANIIALSERFPWAMPLFGFCSGLASFLLVERKQGLAQIIALMILASWCWFLTEKVVHRITQRWFGLSSPRPLAVYATQLMHQESLFFVIPFLFLTTAWNSGQSVYTAILLVAAAITIIDPLYFRWLAPRRVWYFAFHGITLFAVLQTILPIIFYLPTAQSYCWSLGIALLLIAVGIASGTQWRWWKRMLVIVGLVSALGYTGLVVRPWIPPSTLWLTDVAIASAINGAEKIPKNNLKVLSDAELHKGLYAYTAIHAPRGLRERIYHEWKLNGKLIDRVPLDIHGGREAGYRAWSHKVNFPADSTGRWQIRVVTEADQLIGVLRFKVVPDS